MTRHCICYVVDDNYLFPTLVSASQARENASASLADIVILCLSDASDRVKKVMPVAIALGIELIEIPTSSIENLHPMYGRLFIDKLLPKAYERVLYIDGDTQVAGSLEPLLNVDIPEGKFLAVRDPAAMFARLSDKWASRIQGERVEAGLGDKAIEDYLNTGVLVFNMKDWAELAGETLKLIRARSTPFKFGDQDPMNLAIGDRCLYISNRWNFPGFLIGSGQDERVKPVIYHFMSNPRPWVHAGAPWGPKWHAPYKAFLARFPVLESVAPKTTPVKALRHYLQQALKGVTEYGPVSRFSEAAPLQDV